MSRSVCDVSLLIEAINAICDVSEVFDAVVGIVLVFVVDDVCRPCSMYYQPDNPVCFVSFSIDADSSVPVSRRSGDGSFLNFLSADVPTEVFAVVKQ